MKLYNTIKIAVPALMLALSVISCKEESSAADKIKDGAVAASANTPEENEQAKQTVTINQSAAAAPTANGQDITQQFTVPAPAPTKPGMNPPHGQPGHRCDIAVGAPLSSAPAKPNPVQPAAQTTQPVEFAPPAVKDATAATDVVTPPGMNPPHGQPGHVCSVAVGAPLPKE